MLSLLQGAAYEMMLFACCGMILTGGDDLLFDILWLSRRVRGKWKAVPLASLSDAPPTRLAIFTPLWQEAEVIGTMLRWTLAQWIEAPENGRRSSGPDFCLYVGCYCNDEASIAAVQAVAAEHPAHVRIVINPVPGPTTKADNLNTMWQALLADEAASDARFDAVILHDAEDIVHPSELLLYAKLLPAHELVQIPVVPLVNPHSRWVSAHYADEFAEAHQKEMPMRDWLSAPIPSAGVGVALRHDLLDTLARGNVDGLPFDRNSVTEDYELGVKASALGVRSIFIRARADDGSLIASKGLFPADVGASIRQKTRWVLGISLAGWDRLALYREPWLGAYNSSLAQMKARFVWRWMRWRDRRALLAALLLLTAYSAALVNLLCIALYHALGQDVVPVTGLWFDAEALLAATLFLLLWRMAMRAGFTAAQYGAGEALRSLPRALLANAIAIAANSRALLRYVALWRGGALVWDKTSHDFPVLEDTPAQAGRQDKPA